LFGVTRLHLITPAVHLHAEGSSTADESSVHPSSARQYRHGHLPATTVVACQSTQGADLSSSDLRRQEVHQRRAVLLGVSIV